MTMTLPAATMHHTQTGKYRSVHHPHTGFCTDIATFVQLSSTPVINNGSDGFCIATRNAQKLTFLSMLLHCHKMALYACSYYSTNLLALYLILRAYEKDKSLWRPSMFAALYSKNSTRKLYFVPIMQNELSRALLLTSVPVQRPKNAIKKHYLNEF